MGWFNESSGGAFCRAALFLLIAVISAHAYRLPQQKEPGIHLAHICAQLHGAPQNSTPVIMLHGITGRKETWKGIYQSIVLLTGRRVCIYDARNHGDSGWNDTFTLDIMVQDLEDFMKSMKMEKAALVGHSMGGLVATKFALKNPDKVQQLFVEDISPVKVSDEIIASIGTNMKLLDLVLTFIPPDADEDTAKRIIDSYVALVSNEYRGEDLVKRFSLRCRNGVWQWGTNFRALIKAYDEGGGKSDVLIGKMEGLYDKEAVFIYGTASPFKVGDQKEDIKKLFPKAKFIAVEGAGHGIHSEHPVFLSELVALLK